jgi:hypothetical protein
MASFTIHTGKAQCHVIYISINGTVASCNLRPINASLANFWGHENSAVTTTRKYIYKVYTFKT